jgi:hypothetical protein
MNAPSSPIIVETSPLHSMIGVVSVNACYRQQFSRLRLLVKSIGIVLMLAAVASPLVAQRRVVQQVPQSSPAKPNLELRITPVELENGLLKGFSFVFVNVSDHKLRMPRPTQCIGGNGTVSLRSRFKPLNPLRVPSGGAGGCGSGLFGGRPGLLEWVKSWKPIERGESFTVSYSRRELFNFQEDAGAYEFWGEYLPPQLTVQDVSVLESAGFDYPRVPLTSGHLVYSKPQ